MIKIKRRQIQYLVLMCAFITGLAITFIAPNFSYAQNSACDADYYKSLEARAWMEAQREIESNQNLIVKPDSVLEYTCFDKFGSELAEHAKDMFSESTRWGTILPDNSMDNALTSLVGDALVAYQTANFDHKSLGGRGIDKHTFSGNITGGNYTCSQMNDIWQKSNRSAKCYNFQTENHDAFFTFKQFEDSNTVVRALPEACEANSLWADNNKTALGTSIGGSDDNTPWEEDREFTFLDVTKPCTESPTIKTGIQVKISQGQEFAETICLIPGCYWHAVQGGGECKSGQ